MYNEKTGRFRFDRKVVMHMPKKMIIAILLIAVVLLTAVLTGCGNGAGSRDAEQTVSGGVPALHIESGKIVDANGRTVQLTGMSSHGMLWYPQYANANAMQTLKSRGANTFRIAAYSDDESGGYVQKKEETMQFVYLAAENAIATDMYAIVDWHVLRDGNPLANLGSAQEFFREISAHYGDCPNILYEICNEPNGETTWDDICAYAEQVIPVIRSHAPNAVIIVGTPEYSYSVESVIDKPLDYDNVMYSFHFYAGQFDDYYNEVFNRCEKANIPVFVTEWGINYGSDGEPALSQAEQFVTVLNRRNISWTAWSLCNKDEVFSAIRPDCVKLSDWEEEDLTDAGKVFFDSFQ